MSLENNMQRGGQLKCDIPLFMVLSSTSHWQGSSVSFQGDSMGRCDAARNMMGRASHERTWVPINSCLPHPPQQNIK